MLEQINKLKTWVNRANTTSIIFGVLCLFYLNYGVSGNEEIYMGWAKSYFDPDWLPNSFVYDHWVSHRFVFEIIFGSLIYLFGMEPVVALGRLLAAGALAWSLARLFKQIKLTNLESLLVLVVFISVGQNLLPGEWIFMSVESKVFAYPLVFLSLTDILKGHYKLAILYLIGATYLHILVAFWFSVYFFIYLVFNKTAFRELSKLAGIYFLGVLPLLLFIAPNLFSGPTDINGIHLNWIYIFYRVIEQAPFVNENLNVGYGWKVRRVLYVVVFFLLALLVHRRKDLSSDIRVLNNFNIIIPSFLLTFLVLAYFDKTGDMLKYRPFRGTSIGCFLIITEIALLSKQFPLTKRIASTFSHITVVILVILIAYGTGSNVVRRYIVPIFFQDERDKAWKEVIVFSKNQTDRGSIFLIKGISERITWSFSRKTDRDVFVLFKFVPIDKNKWYEWYQRLQVPVENEEQVAALTKKYKLDYYLTVPSRPGIGEVVFENSSYVIYRLPKNE
jgi:Domain of unknown function (DUF6798)